MSVERPSLREGGVPWEDGSVGPNKKPCFIIAEAGVNHNGEIALARDLVDAAYEARADAVKFQTWVTEEIVTKDSRAADYQEANAGIRSQYALLKQLELPQAAFREVKDYAKKRGILFLSTPDDSTSARFLAEMGMPLLKVGSGELTNLPFLSELAAYHLPMIVSTGMATMEEVRAAVDVIRDAGDPPLALLHCVSNYPASPEECNLRAMDAMAEAFQVPVGFSDHTMGQAIAAAAVARGACILEKHLTLDTAMEGPDHACSLDPAAFRNLVETIRAVEAALGDGVKAPSPSEQKTREVVRKEAVAARDLPAGHRLLPGDIALKRAGGGGLPPAQVTNLYGSKLGRGLTKDEAITEDCLERHA